MPAIARNELGGIWHSLDGKPWRAKFHAIQRKSGFVPTELPEPPQSAKDVVLEELRMKKTKPEPVVAAAVPAGVAELQNSIANLRAELADVRGKLASQTTLYDNLKRSAGILAAQNIADVPVSSDHRSPIDKFNEIKDPAARSRFYDEHRAELSKFITPVQS